MENSALLILLEKILGKSNPTSKGNHAFFCPFCPVKHHKPKLEINLHTTEKGENPWHCWVCNTKGKSIKTLFKKYQVEPSRYKDLDLIIKYGANDDSSLTNYINNEISLPNEFIPLNIDTRSLDKISRIEIKHALNYIRERNISDESIIKYNIGFCREGKYAGRIIIPSYDGNGNLNYFVARDYTDSQKKYENPPVSSKNIICFELYINWNAPIIICEGIFDALTIKRNVIPLLGKVLHGKLMEKIVHSNIDKIYIALDKDAYKDSIKNAETLISYGKEVYLVELDGKDASEIGFGRFLNIIEKTEKLNFQNLLEKKLQFI